MKKAGPPGPIVRRETPWAEVQGLHPEGPGALYVRSQNVLEKRGIETVGQLIDLTAAEVGAWKQVGPETAADILAFAGRCAVAVHRRSR